MHLRDAHYAHLVDTAHSLAADSSRPYSSAHLLLAMLDHDLPSRKLLLDRNVVPEDVLAGLRDSGEPSYLVDEITQRCQRMAGGDNPGTLHLLMAMCATKGSAAYELLVSLGVDIARLRTIALALLTNRRTISGQDSEAPRRLFALPTLAPEEPDIISSLESPVSGELSTTQPIDAHQPRPLGSRIEAADDCYEESATVPPTDWHARRSVKRNAETAKHLRHLSDPRVTRHRESQKHADDGSVFVPDENLFPTLTSVGRNLSLAAARNELEPLVGRDEHVARLLDILGKRHGNTPCLVGDSGVGKSAIINGLAYLQQVDPERVAPIKNRTIFELSIAGLLGNAQGRGALNERLATLTSEMEQAQDQLLIFFDDIHGLLTGAEHSWDTVAELSLLIERGDLMCVAATTPDRFKRTVEEIPPLRRRLQAIHIPEPSIEQTEDILRAIAPGYQRHHRVRFAPEALCRAAKLAQRYVPDRRLPEKAISILDLAASRAKRQQRGTVSVGAVCDLVSELTDIPRDRLVTEEGERLLEMPAFLQERIIGHGEELDRLCQVIQRSFAGFRSHRPIGSFLLLGPTGVGKTELAKVLADFLFQNRSAICRLDMSEFSEPHSVARLIGSPPGYVGHEEGGQLTESVRRRPYQIVLLDELEKAHRDVQQLLLQLLDEGQTDRWPWTQRRLLEYGRTNDIKPGKHSLRRKTKYRLFRFTRNEQLEPSMRTGSPNSTKTASSRALQPYRRADGFSSPFAHTSPQGGTFTHREFKQPTRSRASSDL